MYILDANSISLKTSIFQYNVPKLSVKNLKVVKATRKRIAEQTIANLYGVSIQIF